MHRVIQQAIIRSAVFAIAVASCFNATLHAQGQKTTPSDVYAKLELLDRCLDQALEAMHLKSPPPAHMIEREVRPMHVYQMAVQTANMINGFTENNSQAISIEPSIIRPHDVHGVIDRILKQLKKHYQTKVDIAWHEDEEKFENKTPLDVYCLLAKAFVKVGILTKNHRVTPDHVFSQMECGITDANAILDRLNRKVDGFTPSHKNKRIPRDVFLASRQVRSELNRIRKSLGLQTVELPEIPKSRIRPIDVYYQSQFILAELNLIKLKLGMTQATPTPFKVQGKTPTDVYAKAELIQHLLSQFDSANLAE